MAQNSPLVCPTCHTPAAAGQRFCSECGTVLSSEAHKPTMLASAEQQAQISGAQFYAQTTDANVTPPPPPLNSFISPPQQPLAPALKAAQVPAPGTYAVPNYARAPRRSRGWLITSIVLLLVLALGGAGFYVLSHRSPAGNQSGTSGNAQQSTPGGGGSTPGSGGNGNTPTSSGSTTEQLNLSFTYSSIALTITSVEYAASFPDDTRQAVRVSFKESNPTSYPVRLLYGDVTRLMLPDGSVIGSVQTKNFALPAPGISDENWIDFPVSASISDLSTLVLQMGRQSESQMQIPLKPNADLSKFQDKTATPNATFQYAGLKWTMTKAVESLSAAGAQATTGNVYVTLTLQAVNPTNQGVYTFPSTYMRLKAGETTSAPSYATIPDLITAQSSGSGTVMFLVPQGNTTFTLIMLARQGSPPISQVTQDVQIS